MPDQERNPTYLVFQSRIFTLSLLSDNEKIQIVVLRLDPLERFHVHHVGEQVQVFPDNDSDISLASRLQTKRLP